MGTEGYLAWRPAFSSHLHPHVLQQRKVDLPKGARRDLKHLVEAVEGGDELVGQVPRESRHCHRKMRASPRTGGLLPPPASGA